MPQKSDSAVIRGHPETDTVSSGIFDLEVQHNEVIYKKTFQCPLVGTTKELETVADCNTMASIESVELPVSSALLRRRGVVVSGVRHERS